MGALHNFERRLESLVSGMFARAFRSAVQPVEISAALQRELDNNAQILSRDRRLVPNDFHVELAPSDLERLAPYDTAMARDMTAQLEGYAAEQGYVFPGPVTIHYEAADDLTTGRFRIRSQATASVTGGAPPDPQPHQAAPVQRRSARAFLEVNGTRHPLHPPGLVVGRGSEAHLRINDPGVSRQHAEFAVVDTGAPGPDALRVNVRDLGSTNGVTVDGHRVTSVGLRPGSRVTVGTTTLTLVIEEDAGV